MKTNRIALIAVLMLVTTNRMAAAQTSQSRRADELRTAQQTIAWQAQNSKGTHGQLLNTEARKLDDLIADLEQGRSVDPREIDRALDHAERGSF